MLKVRSLFRPFSIRGIRQAFSEELNEDRIPPKRDVVLNVYQESEITAGRDPQAISEFLDKHSITIKGEYPKPILTVDEAVLPQNLKSLLLSKKIEKPTAIQSLCWPMIMSGNDMIGIAQTGSGKTLGFLVPSAMHIKHQKIEFRARGPVAVVLAPTRELVQQISSVSSEFLLRTMDIRHASVFGGASRLPQIDQIRRGASICVATPGRLIDLLSTGEISLSNTSYLVLDEADRMLDMGFEPQLREILPKTHKDRQTVMFSATWPSEIRALARDFMRPDSTRVNIGSTELCANKNVTQQFRFAEDPALKDREVLDTIRKNSGKKILVFCSTKSKVRYLAHDLRNSNIWCVESHGDLSQAQRDRSLSQFRDRTNVMVATDVAARGLDLSNIEIVINYDFPMSVQDYIHRIGRTGRVNNKGVSITYFSPRDAHHAQDLVKILKQAEQEVPPEIEDFAEQRAAPPPRRENRFKPNYSRSNSASNWRSRQRYE